MAARVGKYRSVAPQDAETNASAGSHFHGVTHVEDVAAHIVVPTNSVKTPVGLLREACTTLRLIPFFRSQEHCLEYYKYTLRPHYPYSVRQIP